MKKAKCKKIMNMVKIFTFGMMILVINMQSTSFGMPGFGHDRLGLLLTETAGPRGASRLGEQQITQINRYMDAPSLKLGSWHNKLRHNPKVVALKLSQSTSISYMYGLNIARIHKIADIAHNVRPVDGLKISPKMRKQANKIIRYVETNQKMPRKLPKWVDSSGCFSGKGGGTIATKGTAGISGSAGLAGGYFIISSSFDGLQVIRGATNVNDLPRKINHNTAKVIGAGSLFYSAGLVAFSNPGTATLFLVGVGSVMVIEVGYSAILPYLEREFRAYSAYNQLLPGNMRNASPSYRLEEKEAMDGFKDTYGPGLNSYAQGNLTRFVLYRYR